MLSEDGYDPEDCRALAEVIARIGDRWTVLVVGLLGGGPRRFNDIRRALEGVSQRMLTLTLRALERDGLVLRTQFPTKPPSVEYALTERGETLLGPVRALAQWGRAHRTGIVASRLEFDREQAIGAAAAAPSGVHRISGRGR